MKLAIMSDSHDAFELLTKAVEIANKEKCEYLLFAGDLIAPGSGAEVLAGFDGEVLFVFGNNDGEKFGLVNQFANYANLKIVGGFLEESFDGVKVFMNHWPKYSELAAKSGDYDLCIFGHTHEFHAERVNDTLLLNPSSINPYKATASFVIFDTATQKYERILLND